VRGLPVEGFRYRAPPYTSRLTLFTAIIIVVTNIDSLAARAAKFLGGDPHRYLPPAPYVQLNTDRRFRSRAKHSRHPVFRPYLRALRALRAIRPQVLANPLGDLRVTGEPGPERLDQHQVPHEELPELGY